MSHPHSPAHDDGGLPASALPASALSNETRQTLALLERASDAVLLIEPDALVITWVNDMALRVYGYPRDVLTGMSLTHFRREPDSVVRAIIHRVVAQGGATFQSEHVTATGEMIPVEITARLLTFDGRPFLLANARDLRERRQLERELRWNTHLVEAIVSAAPMAIYSLTPDGIVTFWNRGAERVFGWTAAEAIGQPLPIVGPGQYDDHAVLRDRILHGEPFQELELVRHTKDRGPIDISLSTAPIHDETGHPAGIMAIAHDITRRKRDEAAQQALQAELRELNEELERRVGQRTAQLEAVNRELEAFSYSVSHDLRAPLRAIDGFSRILEHDYGPTLDDEARRLIGIVRGSTKQMATLIDDLLAFARVARSDLTSAPIDMQALVTRVVHDTTAGLAVPPRVTIGGLPPARGDAALLRQVIANLVGNAVKFSARTAAPAIAIDGARQGAMIEYSVRDNGVGFDPQYAHKLFGVFQRLHDRSFEGTGVGLAIVERIVMRHGGRVSATGAPGQGATFRFTLPAAQEGP